jgi:hypothetical protein
MIEPITITLEEKAYKISQLTIGQQCDLQIGVVLPTSADPQENVQRAFQRNMAVIAAALSVDHPELTKEKLWSMRISPKERVAAVDAILEFAGLVKPPPAKEGTAAGEAPAAAAAA